MCASCRMTARNSANDKFLLHREPWIAVCICWSDKCVSVLCSQKLFLYLL
jgi:hypothetical protein